MTSDAPAELLFLPAAHWQSEEMMTRSFTWLAAALLTTTPAAAQTQTPRVYLGMTGGSHFERSDFVNGSEPSVGIVGGVRFARGWAAEVEFGRPTRSFVRERTCQCVSFATTREDFERLAVTERLHEEREVTSSISIGAIYQPETGTRWLPRLFMGVTRHGVRDSQRSTILAVPPGFETRAEQTRPFTSHTRPLGGPTFGGGLSYRLTRRVSVGGDVRYDYGSFGDEINNVWRTSMRTTWAF